MQFYNLRHPQQQVSFCEALITGLGRDRGLFFPLEIPVLKNLDEILRLPFVPRSQKILSAWLGEELGRERVEKLVERAFNFPVFTRQVDETRWVLELFHGPTLAFKDFGARFMAQCLNELAAQEKITILTATSGDTGAAVAHAFHGLANIRVVVLYPEGKISPLQEKLFCTLGGNVETVAVACDFDGCQELVKKAFVDEDVVANINLNSANSINVSRLLAQICYYFEAVAASGLAEPVIAVPSGNFGNLTAGLLAQAMGLQVKRFIAATNANDTVPRYLKSGVWSPKPTVPTSSNAMDVAEPSNWPRVETILGKARENFSELQGIAVSEAETMASIRQLQDLNYLGEPHAAVAACALTKSLKPDEEGIFLATAHPGKFREAVEAATGGSIELPQALAEVADKKVLSRKIAPDFSILKDILLSPQT
jgi:threonine synthase